jgi:hypothetical protein
VKHCCLGSFFVAPARALPVPVSDGYIGLCSEPQIATFSPASAGLAPAVPAQLLPISTGTAASHQHRHSCFPSAPAQLLPISTGTAASHQHRHSCFPSVPAQLLPISTGTAASHQHRHSCFPSAPAQLLPISTGTAASHQHRRAFASHTLRLSGGRAPPHPAMKKLRIVILRFGTARQKTGP